MGIQNWKSVKTEEHIMIKRRTFISKTISKKKVWRHGLHTDVNQINEKQML